METRICKCCGRELPLDQFSKNYIGYTSVCKECNSNNRRIAAANRKKKKSVEEQLSNTRKLRLSEFTSLELIDELKLRGYEGTLTYTEVHTIKIG